MIRLHSILYGCHMAKMAINGHMAAIKMVCNMTMWGILGMSTKKVAQGRRLELKSSFLSKVIKLLRFCQNPTY